MRLRRLVLVMVLPLLMAAQPSVPLELPPPIKFPRALDSAKVGQALIAACANRRWFVEADVGGSITARLTVRRHVLRIRLDYSVHDVAYEYVNSVRLNYEHDSGGGLIHPNANIWLRQLDDEVRLQLQALYLARDPVDVVPLDPDAPVR